MGAQLGIAIMARMAFSSRTITIYIYNIYNIIYIYNIYIYISLSCGPPRVTLLQGGALVRIHRSWRCLQISLAGSELSVVVCCASKSDTKALQTF